MDLDRYREGGRKAEAILAARGGVDWTSRALAVDHPHFGEEPDERTWIKGRVANHLLQGELVFTYRAFRLASGDCPELELFDHLRWAERLAGDPAESLRAFAALRNATAVVFATASAESLARGGRFRGTDVERNVCDFITFLTEHAFAHLAQICAL